MTRLWLCLFLFASGCLPDAEARGGARRIVRRNGAVGDKIGAGVPDAGDSVIGNYQWSWYFTGADCPGYDGGVQPYPLHEGDGGETLAWTYGSDAGTFSCNNTTAWTGGTLLVDGIGSQYIDKALRMTEAVAGAGWNKTTTSIPVLPDNTDMWMRMIVKVTDNTSARGFFGWGAAAGDQITGQLSSTERVLTNYRTDSLTNYAASSAVIGTTAFNLVDIYYVGVGSGGNPRVDYYVNGTLATGTEHTANLTDIAAATSFGIGNCAGTNAACGTTNSTPDIDIVFVGAAIGSLAAQFTGEAMHDADYVKAIDP